MATLTLHDVPDDLVARLKARAKRHRRSLNYETIAALELADAAATGAPGDAVSTLKSEPINIDGTLKRMQEISAGLQATAAAEGRKIRQLPSRPPMTEQEIQAQLDRWRELRSHFKGPPLTSEAIIAEIKRDSHPPELDRFGYRINQTS